MNHSYQEQKKRGFECQLNSIENHLFDNEENLKQLHYFSSHYKPSENKNERSRRISGLKIKV